MLSTDTQLAISINAILWAAFFAVMATVILINRNAWRFRVSTLLMLMAAVAISCVAFKMLFEFLLKL